MSFFVYNERKRLGYIYLEERGLWHKVDRYSVKRFLPEPQLLILDVRDKLDRAHNLIPIEDKVLDLKKRKIVPRSAEHYFTYYLERPRMGNSRLINKLFSEVDSVKIRKFIYLAFKGSERKDFLTVKGDYSTLFKWLSQLYPLVQFVNPDFYCEATVGQVSLEKCASARLLLCNIGDRTLRIAQPNRDHVTQYSALVASKDGEIEITRDEDIEDEEPSGDDVLSWILGNSKTQLFTK